MAGVHEGLDAGRAHVPGAADDQDPHRALPPCRSAVSRPPRRRRRATATGCGRGEPGAHVGCQRGAEGGRDLAGARGHGPGHLVKIGEEAGRLDLQVLADGSVQERGKLDGVRGRLFPRGGHHVVRAGASGQSAGTPEQLFVERRGLDDDAGDRHRRMGHLDHRQHVVERGLVVTGDEGPGIEHEIELRGTVLDRLRRLECLDRRDLSAVGIADHCGHAHRAPRQESGCRPDQPRADGERRELVLERQRTGGIELRQRSVRPGQPMLEPRDAAQGGHRCDGASAPGSSARGTRSGPPIVAAPYPRASVRAMASSRSRELSVGSSITASSSAASRRPISGPG